MECRVARVDRALVLGSRWLVYRRTRSFSVPWLERIAAVGVDVRLLTRHGRHHGMFGYASSRSKRVLASGFGYMHGFCGGVTYPDFVLTASVDELVKQALHLP